MSLYENEYYIVTVNVNGDGYDVTNKQTGVVESREARLPYAIIAAKESMDYFDRSKAKEAKAEVKAAPTLAPVAKFPFQRNERDD